MRYSPGTTAVLMLLTLLSATAAPAADLWWAKRVLSIRRPGRAVRPISRTEFPRASDPPPWGVLATSRADAVGVRLPDWQTALDEHLRSSAGAEGSAGQSQR